MRSNVFRRALVLATFAGACLSLALLTASLGTARWVTARARRTSNPLESDGRVYFGLFEGEKRLNPGYGWRNYHIAVTRAQPTPARGWAWAGAAALAAAALLSSGAAAALAALRVAARARAPAPSLSALFIANSLTMLLSACAAGVWAAEYVLRLQHNVMSDEELANMWSSEGGAELGFSFWLVVGASASAAGNLLCVGAVALERQDEPAPALQEKHNAAIMLY